MKIIGKDKRVDVLRMVHTGVRIQQWTYPNTLIFEIDGADRPRRMDNPAEAQIIFDDVQEIDEMLSALNLFKAECTERIGKFKPVGGR